MKVDLYQSLARKSDQSGGSKTARYLLLGLFGEAGTVLSEVKKRKRDNETDEHYFSRVSEELGDLLWYVSAVAGRNGAKLSTLVLPLLKNRPRNPHEIRFGDIQQPTRMNLDGPSKYLELRLVRLAVAAGKLVEIQTQSLHSRKAVDADAAFTEILRQIAFVATRVGLSMDDVAVQNLQKVQDRWPDKKRYPASFDDDFPNYEQLPKSMKVDIREISTDNGAFVLQASKGIHIGDRLTDNIADPDEYRFHDVFHYAYAAVLGWSPVMRSLLRLKRKSRKEIDDTQDGARAILIEEGISTFIFNEAKRQEYFAGIERGKLSFDLLKSIREFVRGYEVERAPLWLWEEAVLQGYEAFRFLQEHRAAQVEISFRQRKLITRPHP